MTLYIAEESNENLKEIPVYKIENGKSFTYFLRLSEELRSLLSKELCETQKVNQNTKQTDTTVKPVKANVPPTHFWRCAKCRNLISEDDCPYCAGLLQMPVETESVKRSEPAERFRIAGLIGSLLGVASIFLFPFILGIISIVTGIIVIAVNPYEDGEGIKPLWKYKNKSLRYGWSSYFLGNCGIIILIIKLFVKGMII